MHPEGLFGDLTEADEENWTMAVYAKCLDDERWRRACIDIALEDLQFSDGAHKYMLRYTGLLTLHESDKGI